MNTTKGKKQKGSVQAEDKKQESQNEIPLDTVTAEKDEVKNAEERLRVKMKKT